MDAPHADHANPPATTVAAVAAVDAVDVAASALALIPSGQTPPASAASSAALVHVGLGDIELRMSAQALTRLVLDPLADMLGSNALVATMARSAALLGYPMIRKVMRVVKPAYPQPDMPRGADPAIYLCTYLMHVGAAYLLDWHWTLDYTERQDGALHITGARPDSRMDASDHATDGTDGPLSAAVDTTNAGAAARTA